MSKSCFQAPLFQRSMAYWLPSAILFLFLFSCTSKKETPRVLVFSKTTGYRHSSIAKGSEAIRKLGMENGFIIDTTEDANYFNEDSLKNYAAVVFLQSTGNVLNQYQEADFERYIQAGGGFVGIHAAADAEYDWGWYGRLVGGYFQSHPEQQEAELNVTDSLDASTRHLPKVWKRKDEWYNFKKLNPDVKVLLTIDENSYKGGNNGNPHPMAWKHEFDGGRAFYTELGHTEASFEEEAYLKHLLGGIKYAIGNDVELDYSKAHTIRVPEEDRFTKTQLVEGQFFEPTEMAILPNLDILVAQRRGEIMLYKNSTKLLKQAGFLNVYWRTDAPGVNAEEGLLGIQADPDFAKNNFVYVFYSPADTSLNRLSRFVFKNDSILPSSEKIVLEFYSQRKICCHTGGSIAFGQDRMLYVSTGDNTTPFNQPSTYVNNGFAPQDDRVGFEQYDARRTSSNTNDLRGKILRIKINPDGSYSIPEGNLFAKGKAKARPEIYVMGNRNPYRIAVDKKTGWLYWGEVGPDASADSMETRGPRGYDELNQARKAGYFGWPLFVGNNYPYREYDYNSGASGKLYDPLAPVNNSRLNTGLQQLPPVSPAFIWYPYATSSDFPQMGTGGRNAMAGPTYHTDLYPSETRLPEYFNKKVFIYDWMRNFIRLVSLKPNGDFDKMEPFMEQTKLSALIDMEVGPDGKIYLLEYGSGWFSKNADAGLSRIDYNGGNRLPIIRGLNATKKTGAVPLKVRLTATAFDPEGSELVYYWNLGNGIVKKTDKPELDYSFTNIGRYEISVTVKDKQEGMSKSTPIEIYAGNETPEVSIEILGNKSFYFPGKQVEYEVKISDKDDTSKVKDLSNLTVSSSYEEGSDKAGLSMGHQVLTEVVMGKNLMLSLDCKNCHQTDKKSIGPSFAEVAKKYKDRTDAGDYLSSKIIKGGGGVWGEVPMAAHPNLKTADARSIVNWIMTLGKTDNPKSLPAKGKVPPTSGLPISVNGILKLTATYTDNGNNQSMPLTGMGIALLRNSKITPDAITHAKGFTVIEDNGKKLLAAPKGDGWFSLDSVYLNNLAGLFIFISWKETPMFGYDLEFRLDKPNGPLMGKCSVSDAMLSRGVLGGVNIRVALDPVNDGKPHHLYITSKMKDPNEQAIIAIRSLQFIPK